MWVLIFFADRPWAMLLAAVVLLAIPVVWATAITASRGYAGAYGALLVLFTAPIPLAAYGAVYLAHKWTLEPPTSPSRADLPQMQPW